jgi:hypothetical protein
MLDPFHFAPGAMAAIHDRAWIWVGVGVLRELYVWMRLPESRFARAAFWEWLEPWMLGVMAWACIFLRGPGAQFLYFQF